MSHLDWSMGKRAIEKKNLVILDMIATNNWKRPIYFSSTVAPSRLHELAALLPARRHGLPPAAAARPRLRAARRRGLRGEIHLLRRPDEQIPLPWPRQRQHFLRRKQPALPGQLPR
ncbi:MAG: hypothetical protein WKG07_10045 [Hymenobacter sp.]